MREAYEVGDIWLCCILSVMFFAFLWRFWLLVAVCFLGCVSSDCVVACVDASSWSFPLVVAAYGW